MTNDYVLDCTHSTGMDGVFCFIPVEYDADGQVSNFITGLNFLSDSPPRNGRFIGVIHADGQEACDAWCAIHQDTIERLVAEREASHD